MAVTDNFAASTLDLNGKVTVGQPTAIVWGPDGRLYITEVDGDIRVLTVAFGDKNPADSDSTAGFYVTAATTLTSVKSIPNFNDNGVAAGSSQRQVTGIDVTAQYDANGDPVLFNGKPGVTMYVTSSDSRIGAGGDGADVGLDTNSGVITKLVQTGADSWQAIDIVRGLPRSEENHSTNGLQVVQTFDADGKLTSERMIVASGGNANSGAPSNNFAGQQEQPLSGAILEIDLDMLKAMPVLTDPSSGRSYVYNLPTLNDPTRPGGSDSNDPFGGNDGLNSAKLLAGGPVSIYSPGYRNAYDVVATEDGRVYTYDNGSNNSWGGRPIGEAGDNGGAIDFAQANGYIATNLNNGDVNNNDPINLVAWDPSNKDQLHEITRSDDLAGRALAAGQGGAQTYTGSDGLVHVYGGHPNPTRAEGSRAGLLFTPKDGVQDAFLLVSNQDSYGDGGPTDYQDVIAFYQQLEAANPKNGSVGVNAGDLTKKVIAVTPGALYDIYRLADGSGAAVIQGGAAPAGGVLLGKSGLPADIASIVAFKNPIEGDYKEAGKTDGAIDTGNGSINGIAEYTSTILDGNGVKMSGALLAVSLNQGSLIVIGRDANGVVQTTTNLGFTVAADRTTLSTDGGGPLGIDALGDDVAARGLSQAFQGSIWVAKLYSSQIQIFQPANGAVPLAGQPLVDVTDRDGDGIDHFLDPFEFDDGNGYALDAGETLLIDFNPLSTRFPGSISNTGLLGAALDGATPNRDAQTAAENFAPAQQLDGLFDLGGNVLPGGNAPILQIKKVVEGTVVGSANSARDALHTGIRPAPGVGRIEATIEAKNWIPTQTGGVQPGQLAGMMFGDGTQANFLRVVFGSVNGEPGIEVGYEIGDANYTALAKTAVPGLSNASVTSLELRLSIDIASGFAVRVSYRLEGQSAFTEIALNGGVGFTLPAGVLQDVLTGAHLIGSGASAQVSGAAIGFLAETSAGAVLDAVDFNSLRIEAFGSEIVAITGAQVGQSGGPGLDTVIYTGTDAVLAPLAPNVENFDGSGSAANYAVTGNALANVFKVGPGANTIVTGAGADSVRGALDDLAGDTIADFSVQDEVVVLGSTLSVFDVTYQSGPNGVTMLINGRALTFEGPAFAGLSPAEAAAAFAFTQTDVGVRITTAESLTPVIAISSGGATLSGAVVRGQTIDFLSDLAGGPATQFLAGSSYTYTNQPVQTADILGTDLDPIHRIERTGLSANQWGYAIPVEDGRYVVDLYFAEIYHGFITNAANAAPGKRVFDIFVEGQLVDDNFDVILAADGVVREIVRSYEATVVDGVLDIQFKAEVDQAKISGLAVWKVGAAADATAPVILSATVANPPSVQDGPRFATVVAQDETGFDLAALQALTGAELSFTGIVPAAISAPAVTLSADGKTATLIYTLTPPAGAWPSGIGQIAVASGAIKDAAGNGSAAADGTFILEPNLATLVKGDVALAINVGSTNAAAPVLGGAIAADPIIGVALQADSESYYSAGTKTTGNFDGGSGNPANNPALDGSALHTYRDASVSTWTATYAVPNGVYVVELWFAELYWTAAGKRQGDYTINGQPLANDFDAFVAAGGGDTPTKLVRNVAVTDGKVVIGVSADIGQPGFNAIVVYEATSPTAAPAISVGDAFAVEGGEALAIFTRTGDLSEAVTVTFATTPGTASAADFVAPASNTVVIAAGATTATAAFAIVDDALPEGGETFTVTITGVSSPSGAAIIAPGGASGVVTIASSDLPSLAPEGGVVIELDFETPGAPLAEGGFDGALGGAGAIEGQKASIQGGKLVVQTSNGDISQGGVSSKNDFTKTLDLSDPALQVIHLTSSFANPFSQAALTALGVTTDVVTSFAQQGIVFGLGTQNPNEMVKLAFGGVANGNGLQMWSRGQIDQKVALAAALQPGKGLFDIARIEMSLVIEKAAGTVGQHVTFYDAADNVIGGVRPVATPGFFTAPAVAMPAPVLANLLSPDQPTHVGVTSSDFGALGSFTATWEDLRVTSPNVAPPPPPDLPVGTAPGEDLDGDGAANATDPDIDGDGQANATDVFYYDAQNGRALADGETVRLDFNTPGTPFQNGFTGVMQGATTAAGYQKETGAGVVQGGKLVVATTSGDTGGSNNPQNAYHFGIKRAGDFVLETVVDNPFVNGGKTSFAQLGLSVSLDSKNFLKFVAGNVGGDFEFSFRNNDVETKTTAMLPTGFSLAPQAGSSVVEKIKLTVTVSVTPAGDATATAQAIVLDADGQPVAASPVTPNALNLVGALEAALANPQAAVGVGVVHTNGAAPQFNATYEYLEVRGTGAATPPPPTSPEAVFVAIGAQTPDAVVSDQVGAALMKITADSNNIQISNFGVNSFTLENVGQKKIAAVYIDVTGALYGDSVFDPDGSGGDDVAKGLTLNSGGDVTGAVSPAQYAELWLPAHDLANLDPLFDNVGDSGRGSSGGFRGAALKFAPTVNGGFQPGELVGFSVDMDPNSIAGFKKSTVDTPSTASWDVGGVSGAELIGSKITVLFSDGTSATGQLVSDKSQAGAQALITQAPPPGVASLTVNGVAEGGAGVYGGALPEVIVSGPAGSTIRVTMTKGFNPVISDQADAASVVAARLADKDFKVNNAIEFQTVDVVLGAGETSRDISSLFVYNNAPNGLTFSGVDKMALGFVASVVNGSGLAAGPVTRPIYLQNDGRAVVGDVTGGPSGYFLEAGGRVKAQFEDFAGGATPPAGWVFQNAQNGDNAGFQGGGYYYWKTQTDTVTVDPAGDLGVMSARIYIQDAGLYSLRVRSSRDTNTPADQRNDVWVKIDDNMQSVLPQGAAPLINSNGFVKLFGVPGTAKTWGFAQGFDSAISTDPNPPAQVLLSAGFHTIAFVGRSHGFHMDFFELYKDQNPDQAGIQAPAVTAPNSAFAPLGAVNAAPILTSPATTSVLEGQTFALDVNATDADADVLNYGIAGGADAARFSINASTGVLSFVTAPDFEAPTDAGGNNVYDVIVSVTDGKAPPVTQAAQIAVLDKPEDGSQRTSFVATVVKAQDDLEQGSGINSPDLEFGRYVVGLQFTVPAGIDLSVGAAIEEALVAFTAERTHSANASLTFSVSSQINGPSFTAVSVTDRPYLAQTAVWQTSGTWQDGARIAADVNLAPQISALVAAGGLKAGDVITVKVEGAGGVRYADAAGSGRVPASLEITAIGDGAAAPAPASFKIEAEDMSLQGFFKASAGGGATIVQLGTNAPDGALGRAVTTLSDIAEGAYKVSAMIYDENDGVSPGRVIIGEDSFTFAFDGVFPGQTNDGNVANRRLVDIGETALTNGELVTLEVQKNEGELGRVDYLLFTPLDDGLF